MNYQTFLFLKGNIEIYISTLSFGEFVQRSLKVDIHHVDFLILSNSCDSSHLLYKVLKWGGYCLNSD